MLVRLQLLARCSNNLTWFTVCLVALMFLLCTTAALAENFGTLNVHVVKLNNNKGVVRVALYNSEKAYNADKGSGAGAFKREVVKIDKLESFCSFSNLPFGEYAVKLFHDEDNSGRFKKNIFKVTCVQYGYSNNHRVITLPPSFKKAKFQLSSEKKDIEIFMQQR